jgi:hypothetical protein
MLSQKRKQSLTLEAANAYRRQKYQRELDDIQRWRGTDDAETVAWKASQNSNRSASNVAEVLGETLLGAAEAVPVLGPMASVIHTVGELIGGRAEHAGDVAIGAITGQLTKALSKMSGAGMQAGRAAGRVGSKLDGTKAGNFLSRAWRAVTGRDLSPGQIFQWIGENGAQPAAEKMVKELNEYVDKVRKGEVGGEQLPELSAEEVAQIDSRFSEEDSALSQKAADFEARMHARAEEVRQRVEGKDSATADPALPPDVDPGAVPEVAPIPPPPPNPVLVQDVITRVNGSSATRNIDGIDFTESQLKNMSSGDVVYDGRVQWALVKALLTDSVVAYGTREANAFFRAHASSRTVKNRVSEHIALLTHTQLPRYLVIACRGTMDISDWMTNLNTLLVNPPAQRFVEYSGNHQTLASASTTWEQVQVHKGFEDMVEQEAKELVKVLTQTLFQAHNVQNEKFPVYFVGHSLGGAMAQLISLRRDVRTALVKFLGYEPAIQVCTFGAPRVGNGFWKNYVDSQPRFSVTRFENVADVVPYLPPILFGYTDVGLGFILHSDGITQVASPTTKLTPPLGQNLKEHGTVAYYDMACRAAGADGQTPGAGLYARPKLFFN